MKMKKTRKQLHKAINKYGLSHEKCMKEGRKIDKLAIKQMKEYCFLESKGNLQKSLEALLLVTIQLETFPTVIVWNRFAKENNKLSSISLEYMTGKNWNQLRASIYKEIKNRFKEK